MTPASIRILAFAAFASLPLLAQQPPSPNPQPSTGSSPQATSPQQTNPEPGASQNSNPNATPAPHTADSPEVANPQLRPITGELQDKLDTKTSKSGDSVVVKTTEQATTANGVEIPKGSKITGHIIEVAAKGQDGENSRVTIQFDQAEIKGGQSMPIRSVIQSVSPPGATGGPDAAGGPAAATPSSGSTATGGGAGMAASRPSGNASNPSATPNQSNPTEAQNSTQPATGGGQEAGTPPAPGTVVATKGNIAIRTTSIPGVLLIGSVNGQPFSNAAGALLGARQDVHLDNGTVMVVAIAAAPPAVSGQRQ
jgi:hypothetical protein